MASINRVNLAGNLTSDPEIAHTNDGTPVTKFGLAVAKPGGRPGRDSGADFFTVIVWGGLAEVVAGNKKKGDAVAIEGRIDHSSYEDEAGNKRSRTRIVAHDVQFLESSGGGLNRVVLLGNLTRDPETKRVTVGDVEGVPVANFGLAVSRVRSQKENAADFVDVDCWRELGEIVQANKRKGHGVLVTGRLTQERWKNGQGEACSKVKVVADAVQFTTTGRGKVGAGANGTSHRGSGGKEATAPAHKKQYRSRYSR